MVKRVKQKPYPLSQRVRLMGAFLKNAQQYPDYFLAEKRLNRAEGRWRQVLATLTPEDRKTVETYIRASDLLADATAAIAFFMGMAEGRKQKRWLHSFRRRGKV